MDTRDNRTTTFLLTLVAALLLLPSSMHAQTGHGRTIEVSGMVKDGFTGAELNAFVTLTDADSTVVDTMTCNQGGFYWFDIPAKKGKYFFRAELEGYKTTVKEFDINYIARNRSFDVPLIEMKRETHELSEVTVTATKIRMVQHGDTLIFNADAFNVPEGSMLDALIAQLPGTELKSNGEITVNGRKIDYLTLNGDDFFKGNNKVMLENLPYYTVKDIRVYDKQTRESKHAGRDLGERDYVMDVNLKKEYSHGYMANAELGGGTKRRYSGRAFLLGFTPLSRLGVYGNMNNLSHKSEMRFDEAWSPDKLEDGEITNKMAGVTYKTHNKAEDWEERATAEVAWRNADVESLTFDERYSNPQGIFSHGRNLNGSHDFNFKFDNTLFLMQNKPLSIDWTADFGYDKHRTGLWQADSTYTLEKSLNELTTHERGQRHTTNANTQLFMSDNLPWGDIISLTLSGNISSTRNTDDNARAVAYHQTGADEYRNILQDDPSHKYGYSAKIEYNIPLLSALTISPSFTYAHDYSTERNHYFDIETSILKSQSSNPNSRDNHQTGNSYDETIRIAYNPNSKNGRTFYSHLIVGLEERHDKYSVASPASSPQSSNLKPQSSNLKPFPPPRAATHRLFHAKDQRQDRGASELRLPQDAAGLRLDGGS